MRRRLVIAIDGPAGAGKSSAAKLLARRLGYTLLDTGAIYRALALIAREHGIAWSDGPKLAKLARALEVRFRSDGERNRVSVGTREVTDDIRQPDMGEGASQVSALAEVRQALLELQRRLAAGGGVVAEGRDTGTVVFPHADVKIFLTASAEERARRRFEEERGRGLAVDYDRTLRALVERDQRDQNRAIAPLRPAPDAVMIDTSGLSLPEVVERLLETVDKRGETH